jgi:hypothetical protein
MPSKLAIPLHVRCSIIILSLVALTFGNSLANRFIGDDEIVIVKNDFYKSSNNLKRLFDQSYITDSDSLSASRDQDYGSGSVAYRPVLSATYFVDYALWQLNPFGYHLTNFLLHLATSLLIYWLFFFIITDAPIALFAALIFALHPLRSEAVCSIGYRADLLATFFICASLLLYMYYRKLSSYRLLFCSMMAYTLALFSKESVISFPIIYFLYDVFILHERKASLLKEGFKRYSGYLSISIFYLYLYLCVFKNKTLGSVHPLEDSILKHVVDIFIIFGQYVLSFVNPLSVKNLPPLYKPAFDQLWVFQCVISLVIFVFIIMYLVRLIRQKNLMAFFVGWFLVTFIPVSNLWPLVNPMANRFMYLPSIGLSAWLGLWILKDLKERPIFKEHTKLIGIFKIGFLLACIFTTVPLNAYWKDNTTMALALIQEYPQDPSGYLHASKTLLENGYYPEAKAFLQKSLALGGDDPRIFYYLGLTNLNNFKESTYYFERGYQRFPRFGLLSIGYARSLLFAGKPDQAQAVLNQTIKNLPTYTSYGYLIQALLIQNRKEEAQQVLKESLSKIDNPDHKKSLQKLFTESPKNLPVELGI